MSGVSCLYYSDRFGAESNHPNGKIVFNRKGSTPESLEAQVEIGREDKWIPIDEVLADQISVEMDSASKKIKILMEAREKQESPIFESKGIKNFTIEEQDKILNDLENGSRYIEIELDEYSAMRVVHLTIFYPS